MLLEETKLLERRKRYPSMIGNLSLVNVGRRPTAMKDLSCAMSCQGRSRKSGVNVTELNSAAWLLGKLVEARIAD